MKLYLNWNKELNHLVKFWLWLFVATGLSIWFVQQAYSLEPFIQHSTVLKKKPAPQEPVGKLLYELGVVAPSHGILNPCFDLESYAHKWCTPHAMKLILQERYLVKLDELLLMEMLRHEDSCQQISTYIGRVCEQENFKKIFRHFSIKK